MPAEMPSLTYVLYTFIGTGCLWLATKVVRERIVNSTRIRSGLAMVPLLFPLVLLLWVRPNLSHVVLRMDGVLRLLDMVIGLSIASLSGLSPWMVLSYLRLETLLLHLLAQYSGVLFVVGVVTGTGLAVVSRLFGERIIQRTHGTVPIEDGEMPELEEMVARVAKRAGIPTPRILLTEDLRPGAFTVGSRESGSVVFSVGLLACAAWDELEAITAHEVTHLKNRDNFVNLLIGWLRIFSFYNPVAHMAASDAAKERELLADEGAVKLVGEEGPLIGGLELAAKGWPGPRRIGIATALSGFFSMPPFLSRHPTPQGRIVAASRPRRNTSKTKRTAWAAIAVSLAAISICLPAEMGKAIGKGMFPPPPLLGPDEHGLGSGSIDLSRRPNSSLPAPPVMIDDRNRSRQGIVAIRSHDPSLFQPGTPHHASFPAPGNLTAGDRSHVRDPSIRPEAGAWFRALVLATKYLSNIY